MTVTHEQLKDRRRVNGRDRARNKVFTTLIQVFYILHLVDSSYPKHLYGYGAYKLHCKIIFLALATKNL